MSLVRNQQKKGGETLVAMVSVFEKPARRTGWVIWR